MAAHQSYTPTTYYYVNVIDIALPYHVPHVIAFSRLNQGFLSSLMASDKPYFDKSIASRVELEGDFSQFVDVYTTPGQDINAFVYLAPNIMELVLRRASEFSIEFIDNHIYITFRQQKAAIIRPPANTSVSAKLHEHTLQLGLEVGQTLARAARPASQQSSQPAAKIPRPDAFGKILHSVLPVLILLLVPGTVWVVGMMIVMFTQFTIYSFLATFILPILIAGICSGTLVKRYARESHRYRAYKKRYAATPSTETLSPTT